MGEGSRLKETEFFGQQDPYAVVTIGAAKQKTRVHKGENTLRTHVDVIWMRDVWLSSPSEPR